MIRPDELEMGEQLLVEGMGREKTAMYELGKRART
jgi:hypothetical protein